MHSVSQISQHIQSDKLLTKIPSPTTLRAQLRWYSQYFSRHLIHNSAKWTSQLLIGITSQQQIQSIYLLKTFISNNLDHDYTFQPPRVREDPDAEDILGLVRTLFSLKEYKKCIHLLEKRVIENPSPSVVFFYYYSRWMAYQIRKEEEFYENGSLGNYVDGQMKTNTNPELVLLSRKLRELYQKKELDGICLYLYGLVLKEEEKMQEARNVLLEVLNSMPCFWSCWIELSKIAAADEVKNFILCLKDHWMKNFFFSSFCLEKYKNSISTEINYGLFCFFKNSTFLMNQISHCFYNNQGNKKNYLEFDVSLDWFDKLVGVDPYRVENMDIFSNILYIKEKQGQLATLAMRCFYNNKYTPETCCVVGNYYSLIGEHNKAISNFRKALKLDKNCLGAWTLMGHQCLQLKNIPGAIEAYRSAIQVDPKDFRAWYGLGQTYQLQKMNNYALYYFTKAAMSRPKDARMWNAMACCYDAMDKKTQASKCYQRAENCKDRQGIAIHQLAKLYSLMGDQYESKAVETFELNLKRKNEQGIIDREVGECLGYLTKHYARRNELIRAAEYARRLQQFEGPLRDEANEVLDRLAQVENSDN